jgi:hypothetical protein
MVANVSGIAGARTIPRMKALLRQRATYDDLTKVPENMVAELIDGDLYAWPRPAGPHARFSSALGMDIGTPYDRGRGGPGGGGSSTSPSFTSANRSSFPILQAGAVSGCHRFRRITASSSALTGSVK